MNTQHQHPSHPGNTELLERYNSAITGVFGTPGRVLVRGEGVYVWDADGKHYTDLLGGIAVNALGHAHPALVSALTQQLGTLGHISNLFTSEPQIGLAEKLLDLAQAPQGSVFFSNSGSEANEAALKIARAYGKKRPAASGQPRTRIVALTGAFHGRTMGAVSMTFKEAYREPFTPVVPDIVHLRAGDLKAVEAELASGEVAAVILEPVQGEAGVHGFEPGYLAGVRAATREAEALLIFDEIQSGMGRTGTWFAHQNPEVTGSETPVVPDVMTLAKSLGAGIPVGATVSFTQEVSEILSAGQHGTTFGGNPLATRAGMTVIDIIEQEGLLTRARTWGTVLSRELSRVPGITQVRAYGAWAGIDLDSTGLTAGASLAPAFVTAALNAGFLVNATGPATLRLAPALTMTEQELTPFLNSFESLLNTAKEAVR